MLEIMKKLNKKKLIVILSIILAITSIYLIGLIYFSSHFLFSTTLENVDVSRLNVDKANELLSEVKPKLIIKEKDINGNELNEEIDLTTLDKSIKYDASYSLSKQSPLTWFIPNKKELSCERITGTYTDKQLDAFIENLYCAKQENIKMPTDAHLDIVNGEVAEVESDNGSYISKDTLKKVIKEKIDAYMLGDSNVLDLSSYYETATITLNDLDPSLKENILKQLDKTITIDMDYKDEIVDKDVIIELTDLEDNKLVVDNDGLSNYIYELSKNYDGLKKDSLTAELNDCLLGYDNKTIYAEFVETRSVLIEVDISEQTLYYYENGNLVFTSDVVTGNEDFGTATIMGDFEVQRKVTDTNLMGRDYLEHVDYWIGFDETGRIYGFHDAPWRDAFGGDIYLSDPSRGCVNMPHDKVEMLFNYVEIGDAVSIHN